MKRKYFTRSVSLKLTDSRKTLTNKVRKIAALIRKGWQIDAVDIGATPMSIWINAKRLK